MKVHAIAIDDGNAQFNVISSSGKFKFDTLIQRGKVVQGIALLDEGKRDEDTITVKQTCNGDFYSIGQVDQPIERHDNFGFSDGGKVLIQHALSKVQEFEHGTNDDGIVLCTGLPLRMFYKSDGTMNAENINKKINAVKDSFNLFDLKDKPKLVQTIVQAEAVVAAFSLTLCKVDGQWTADPNYKNKVLAVCDPGGKTTDIAIIEQMKVNMDLSTTAENLGMNSLIKKAKDFIYDLGIRDCTESLARSFINTGSISLKGENHNYSTMVNELKRQLANKIVDQLVSSIGNGNRVDEILMIGGTTEALREQLEPILAESFPNHEIKFLGDFANADGLYAFTQLFIQRQKY